MTYEYTCCTVTEVNNNYLGICSLFMRLNNNKIVQLNVLELQECKYLFEEKIT